MAVMTQSTIICLRQHVTMTKDQLEKS